MTCLHCKNKVRSTDRFCSKCGQPLPLNGSRPAKADITDAPKEKKIKDLSLALLSVSMLVIILFFKADIHTLYYFVNSNVPQAVFEEGMRYLYNEHCTIINLSSFLYLAFPTAEALIILFTLENQDFKPNVRIIIVQNILYSIAWLCMPVFANMLLSENPFFKSEVSFLFRVISITVAVLKTAYAVIYYIADKCEKNN